MEELVKGDVVVLPFPFSDLSGSKKRPAYVAATLEGEDVILCQITSVARSDSYAVSISNKDFISGKLPVLSVARLNRLFSAEKSIIVRKVGNLNRSKIQEIEDVLVDLFQK